MEASYPLDLEVETPSRVARWRPLVNWLLVLPLAVWAGLLGLGAAVVSFLGWFAILLTGRLPQSWSDYLVAVLRYHWRTTAYLYAWTDSYPGFSAPAGHVDPGDHPAVLYCAPPGPRRRLTVALRALLAIPHLFVLYFVEIAQGVVLLVAWFAVVVLGRWPEDLRRFAVGVFRWAMRVNAYLWLVTDEYPPFRTAP
jgi:hypothetical protein